TAEAHAAVRRAILDCRSSPGPWATAPVRRRLHLSPHRRGNAPTAAHALRRPGRHAIGTACALHTVVPSVAACAPAGMEAVFGACEAMPAGAMCATRVFRVGERVLGGLGALRLRGGWG
ncbi:MAG: hypothetical protein ACPGUV_05285, partial [Polyangiales bacterium]